MTWALALGLCTNAMAQAQLLTGESLFDLHSMRETSVAALTSAIRQADVAVLGEIHDNPRHHAVRGQLLRMLGSPARNVVAEHLTAPAEVDTHQALLPGLQAAGFDPVGWQWPLHEAVFAVVKDLGWPLRGGNISKVDSQQTFKTKGLATALALQDLLSHAALNEQGKNALQHEIDVGHCGALPAEMLEGMMAVQRARDASMAHMALRHLPAVVLAGNGHAWKHLGVPQIIQANQPKVKVISVLFLEHETFANEKDRADWLQQWTGQADYIWSGPALQRPDPCLKFRTPQ